MKDATARVIGFFVALAMGLAIVGIWRVLAAFWAVLSE